MQPGLAKLGKSDLDGAAEDLLSYTDLAQKDEGLDYARLYLWLIAAQKNFKAHGDQDLSDVLLNDWNSPPGDMVTKIAKFLLGRLSEDDLIAAADSPSDPVQNEGSSLRQRMVFRRDGKRLLDGDQALGADHSASVTADAK